VTNAATLARRDVKFMLFFGMAKTRKDSQANHCSVVQVSGGWAVRGSGSKIGRRVCRTKAEAERDAKRIASENTQKLSSSTRSGTQRDVFTVGRNAFAKISAIEGLYLSSDMKRDFREFDQKRLTSDKRRRAIISKYDGKAP